MAVIRIRIVAYYGRANGNGCRHGEFTFFTAYTRVWFGRTHFTVANAQRITIKKVKNVNIYVGYAYFYGKDIDIFLRLLYNK